jgi:hypothetical protein
MNGTAMASWQKDNVKSQRFGLLLTLLTLLYIAAIIAFIVVY